MTGDGHSDDILKGLKKNAKLSADDSIHVNILKIQHRGAEANIDEEFCKKVTADNYVFCGNGSHHNPKIAVIDAIYNSRRSNGDKKSSNTEVDDDFKFWFNSSKTTVNSKKQKAHMKKVKNKVKALKARSGSQGFKYDFMNKNQSQLEITCS